MPTTFEIAVVFQQKKYVFGVVHKPIDKKKEHFTVTGYGREYLIRSNRPYVRFHQGLKKREPAYQVVRGQFNNTYFQKLLTDELKKYVRENLF